MILFERYAYMKYKKGNPTFLESGSRLAENKPVMQKYIQNQEKKINSGEQLRIARSRSNMQIADLKALVEGG